MNSLDVAVIGYTLLILGIGIAFGYYLAKCLYGSEPKNILEPKINKGEEK